MAAVFAREFEMVEAPTETLVARLTVDLMRPVPTKPLEVETRTVRAGRRIQVLESSMTVEGVEVARASGLRIRLDRVPVPDHPARDTPDGPEGIAAAVLEPQGEPYFHVAGVEIRFRDGDFYQSGPATGWIRLAMPLFAGEEPTPLQRVAAVADFGNDGFSRVLGNDFVFMNPDLTVYLSRVPVGEWLCLRSRSDISDDGLGMAQSELFDADGAFGHAVQSLFVDRADAFKT